MHRLNALDWTAIVLVVIGGINWGLIGSADFNLVTAIFGSSTLARIIYVVVGLAAVFTLIDLSAKTSHHHHGEAGHTHAS